MGVDALELSREAGALVGTRAQIDALSRYVQSLMRSHRLRSLVAALVVLAGCFVEPPPVQNETDTDDPCADQAACACMPNGCQDASSDGDSADTTTPTATTDADTTSGATSSASMSDGSSEDADASADASESGSDTSVLDSSSTG